MTSSSFIATTLLLLSAIIYKQTLSQVLHDGDKFTRMRLQSDSIGANQQLAMSSFNQRPTQFIASSQLHQATAHSPRGALVLPANNEIQASNFHLTIDPTSIRNHYPNKPQQHAAGAISDNILRDSSAANSAASAGSSNNNLASRNNQRLTPNNDTLLLVDQSSSNNNSLLRGISESDLELALRQANSDENVFPPAAAMIPTAGYSYDQWSLNARASTPTSSSAEQQDEKVAQTKQQEHQQAAASTTDQSNSIVPVSLSPEASSGGHHHQSLIIHGQIMRQQELAQQSQPTSGGGAQQSGNQPIELSNQVFYEGPATAPPVAGDYYFSSAERAPPNNEKASSNIWWSLGLGYDFERASNLTRDDYLDYCAKSELLISNKQRLLCRSHPKIMSVVAKGLKMAIDECQSRFTSSRWNCSLVLQNSILGGGSQTAASSRTQVFGEVMKHPNRERSFLNAIIAAGLAQSMTKACSQGELPEECSCDKRIKSRNSKGKIEWVACSDDIDFGARFSRDFTDSGADNDSDTISMINTHNYEVGRRVFKSATDITCSCLNGENGLCQTKRCWRHLGPFTDIGDELMKRYESATHVQPSNKDPHKLRPVRRGVRRPKRKDLVYIDESPDYCSPDSRLGVLGTQNRRCNSTSAGPDSCSLLCCGRGYQMVTEEIEEDCNCKFVWCCQVKCDKCKLQVTNDVCN